MVGKLRFIQPNTNPSKKQYPETEMTNLEPVEESGPQTFSSISGPSPSHET